MCSSEPDRPTARVRRGATAPARTVCEVRAFLFSFCLVRRGVVIFNLTARVSVCVKIVAPITQKRTRCEAPRGARRPSRVLVAVRAGANGTCQRQPRTAGPWTVCEKRAADTRRPAGGGTRRTVRETRQASRTHVRHAAARARARAARPGTRSNGDAEPPHTTGPTPRSGVRVLRTPRAAHRAHGCRLAAVRSVPTRVPRGAGSAGRSSAPNSRAAGLTISHLSQSREACAFPTPGSSLARHACIRSGHAIYHGHAGTGGGKGAEELHRSCWVLAMRPVPGSSEGEWVGCGEEEVDDAVAKLPGERTAEEEE